MRSLRTREGKLMADNPGWQQPSRAREWVLREFDLFADLDESEMAAIAAAAPMSEVPKGQLLASPLSPREVLFIVKKGRVRLYRTAVDGRSLTTAIVEPGEMFGEMTSVGQSMVDTWAECLEPAVLCVMSRSDVQRLLLSDPRIAARIAQLLGQRLTDMERRLSDTVLRPVPARIAAALATMAGEHRPAVVRLTHEQLAELVGTTRETTTKVLGDLQDRGLLSLRRGKIVISDPRRLEELADDEVGVSQIRTR